ncbi:MAG TPA: J domain-containing protein [Hyphomicrobium sp.]
MSIFAFAAMASASATFARADDLVIPYACEMDHGSPRLLAASANVYHIIGPREDRPFPTCSPSPTGKCETMMIHKFVIECAGQKVAWAKVALSARALGIELPAHLPAGFAPVSRLQGRFVLPGFGRTTRLARVATQTLSPDSVIETSALPERDDVAQWVTVVDPAVIASAPGGAFKVAGVISTMLVSLMAACLLVAWRRPLSAFEFTGASPSDAAPKKGAARFIGLAYARVSAVFQRSYRGSPEASDSGGNDSPAAASLALVDARLTETEFLVASLPANLLLRDVLQSELDGLRQRAGNVSRRASRLGAERLSGMLRSLTRDLDRIARIVHGAAQKDANNEPTSQSAPATVFEAYRILGLNPAAPHAAVKKVVDALRMSWHPDHARDETDRLHREERIKQINAAWDLLKNIQRAEVAESVNS